MAVSSTTVQVVMPAMGDSVTEGTVLEWHKAEGETVAADETLVEISTDKVDAEVPAPAGGTVLCEIAGNGDGPPPAAQPPAAEAPAAQPPAAEAPSAQPPAAEPVPDA